jgi:L-ascorbate metabolism protein UlaG (beta-lactamase superfamily)
MATLPAAGQGELLFIGTATTLLRYGGFTLLTDPNFLRRGQRAYLGYGLTTRRLTEPAMRLDELPELDAVVLSHLHGDHFDRVASRGLDRDLAILTTPAGARRLQLRRFSRAVGLRTWTSQTLHRDGRTLRVTALPGTHAKGALRALLPPVMGTLLDFLDAAGRVEYRIYVSGDTLMFDGVHTVAERYPDIDLLVVHLGGTTLPGGRVVTMDGDQGVQFLRAVAPRRAAPVHYDDYDRFRSPLEDFQRRAEAAGLDGICSYLRRGETLALMPRGQQVPEA